jgi:hypothetical protein
VQHTARVTVAPEGIDLRGVQHGRCLPGGHEFLDSGWVPLLQRHCGIQSLYGDGVKQILSESLTSKINTIAGSRAPGSETNKLRVGVFSPRG